MAYYVFSYCVSFIFSGYGNTGLEHLAHNCSVMSQSPLRRWPWTQHHWMLCRMMIVKRQCNGNPDEGFYPSLDSRRNKTPNFCIWERMTHISRKKQEHTQPFKMVAISTYLKNTIIFGAFLRVYLTCIIKDLICHWIFLYHYY